MEIRGVIGQSTEQNIWSNRSEINIWRMLYNRDFRILHSRELHNLYSLSNIIR
jgi:hypothetical protein